jgi:adenylate kinase
MVFFARADCGGASKDAEKGDVRHHRIIFLGPPGSGKGTAAAELSAVLEIPHVSTGQMFREQIRRGGSLGDVAKQFIDKGQLVPDGVTMEIVRLWLGEHGRGGGFIFDGFPRTRTQAEAFDCVLRERGMPITVAILLEVSDTHILGRVLGRVSCENCGALYHGTRVPPQQMGICDQCGGPLTRRADDTEETVRKRLNVYRELTLDVVQHYERAGILKRVDGSRLKKEVFPDVLRIVKS